MKKKLWDMTLKEIMHLCDSTKDCKDCPFKSSHYCWDDIRAENNFSQEVDYESNINEY